MIRSKMAICALALLLVAALACNAPAATTPEAVVATAITVPTETAATPTAPPAENAPLSFLVQTLSNDILLVQPDGQSSPFAQPGFSVSTGPHSVSGVAAGTLYAVNGSMEPAVPRVYAIDSSGARPLDFISQLAQWIAIWPGDGTQPPDIAWGEIDWQQTPPQARLWLAPIGGLDVIKVAEESTPEGYYYAPVRFSADGKRLYYSEEPTGLGGYILFGGFSSLFVYDIETNTNTALIPRGEGGTICLDDLSPDEQWIAMSCGSISVKNLQTGETISVALPDMGGETIGQQGSGRFSPDGTKLAYGFARGQGPDGEQGWAAVADWQSGTSRILATAPTGAYFNVMGWLDNNTVVLQTFGEHPVVWVVTVDGSGPDFQTEGLFLTLVKP